MNRYSLLLGLLLAQGMVFGQELTDKTFMENLLERNIISKDDAQKVRRIKLFQHSSKFFGELVICNMAYGNLQLPVLRRFLMNREKDEIIEVNAYFFKKDIDIHKINGLLQNNVTIDNKKTMKEFIEEFENLSQSSAIANNVDEIINSIDPVFSDQTKRELINNYKKLKFTFETEITNNTIYCKYFTVNKTYKYLVYENEISFDLENNKIKKYNFRPTFSESDLKIYFRRL